jgi:alkylation response protein AidB-like acyl-CoA dehydrogenase
MNFELNNTQKDLQNTMAAFCHAEILPGAASLDTSPQDQIAVALKTNMKKLGNAGYLNLLLEDDLISQCVAGEEVAKACPATFITTMSTATAFGIPLKKFGTPSQREKCLSAIVMGDYIGGLACTEFDAGSDMNGFKTFAERKGDRWVLSGYKYLVTNAPIADALLVLAWTDREAGLEKGLSFFILEKGAKGISISQPMETMGLRGALVSEMIFEKCELEADALLGGEAGRGYGQFMQVMEYIKLALSAMSVGLGVACMENSTRYAKYRSAFGKPIGLFEGVGAKLAIMFTYNDLGRMMAYRAAWAMEQQDPESPVLTSCAKLFTSEAVNEIADLAMQVHGGHGYLKGSTVERLYRDARYAVIAYGTSEMQRAFIARDSLDRFKPA